MSPRPKATSDAELLAAAHRVVMRLGPNLTLADVAKEAHVSAATLVQTRANTNACWSRAAASIPRSVAS